jgi:hypothetical protein
MFSRIMQTDVTATSCSETEAANNDLGRNNRPSAAGQ